MPIEAPDCERLLRSTVFGRMVLATPGRLEIFTVNYAVMGDAVVLRTTPGSLLDRYADGAPLILEVDNVNHERWQGWSVVVRGQGERITQSQLTVRELGSFPPPPWAPGRSVWIRLQVEEISGRKLGPGPLLAGSLGETLR